MADASSMSLMAKLNSITSRSYIEDVIGRSADKEKLRAVFSDHFDDLSAPVSVSLGLYSNEKNVGDIVKLLRSNGIDAVPYYDKRVKDDLGCFVVDGTGIRSPFLNPKDAVKATADICEIMNADGISTSRALPVSRQNLIPAVDHTYDGQIIDIARNNPNERDVDLFLAERLNSASNEMQAVSPVSVKGRLYRGATLGDKPYALTFHRRPRDAAYATKDFAMAATYADGEKGAGFKYKKVNGKAYGFIYEFKEREGQQYYGMAGVEKPEGSEECVGHPDNRPDYETLVFPDRNPLTAVYLNVGGKVVQIADANGYISKDWEKFAKLHTPYNVSEKNDYMVERMNRQISEPYAASYERKSAALDNDAVSLTPDLYGLAFGRSVKELREADKKYNYEINNANFSAVTLPEETPSVRFTGDLFLTGCSAPKEMKTLDLSDCTGIIGLTACDLTNVDKFIFPKKCNVLFLSNVKLPEGCTLDFGKMKCNGLTFENQDLSGVGKLIEPEGVIPKPKGNTVAPKGTDINVWKNAHKQEANSPKKERNSPSAAVLRARVSKGRG